MSDNTYAEVAWTAEDVQTLRPDLTDEQAEDFLNRNEKHLRDRLVELGWEVMGTLLDMDDDVPPKPCEGHFIDTSELDVEGVVAVIEKLVRGV